MIRTVFVLLILAAPLVPQQQKARQKTAIERNLMAAWMCGRMSGAEPYIDRLAKADPLWRTTFDRANSEVEAEYNCKAVRRLLHEIGSLP